MPSVRSKRDRGRCFPSTQRARLAVDPNLIFWLTFAIILLFGIALAMVVSDLSAARREKFQQRVGGGKGEPELAQLPLVPGEQPPQGMLASADHRFLRLVIHSGVQQTPFEMFLLALLFGLAIGGALFVWQQNLLLASLGMLLGYAIVLVFLLYRHRRRRAELRDQLPDVMDLMARSVRAGQSLDQAVAMAGDSAPAPLGIEFRRCARQLEMGLPLDTAMRALAQRVPISEMRILGATLMVQRRTGGNLPDALERLVRVVRDRLEYQRQFRAQTAGSRFASTMIALAGPAVAAYFFIWRRDYVDVFFQSLLGNVLLATAVLLIIIGVVWVFRLTRSDY